MVERCLLLVALSGASVVLGATGCGEASDTTAATSGDLAIVAAFEPPGPRLGENTLRVEVRHLDDAPAEDATVTVTPWMPAHGHGSPRTPVVTPLGAGRYRADDVVLHMPGTWQLTVRAEAGEHAGERIVAFDLAD